jgi:putative DNA primase/helicase
MTAAEKLSLSPDAPMLDFALEFARRAWPVFPCKQNNKAPWISGGLNSASTDPEIIRQWWTNWPRAMIGVPMGSRSGVWAIDPDPPKKEGDPDGRVVWADLLKKHGALPATHVESTPRGGQHVLFKWDPERPVTNSPGALKGQSIDVRGEGGYVIVAPSVCTGDGGKNVAGQYGVVEPLDYFHFAAAPDWVYELVLQPEPAPERDEKQVSILPVPRRKSLSPKETDPFWRNVNSLAMERLSSWVPSAFPKACFEKNTGAWRITSRDLGRDLEEDLSISPKGIKDWGVWDIGDPRGGRRSPIGLLIEHGIASDAVEAAHWLCDRCGVDSGSLGWRQYSKAQEAGQIVAEAEEIDNGTITQDGIARVFARRFEDKLRYCHDTGAWFEWTATHWKKDKTDLAFNFCRELGREFTENAKTSELKEVRKFSFAGGVERFARSDRLLAVTSETWDADPFLLGTPGGTVDLRTGELREPNPRDGITKITAVSPSTKADCPRWVKFMDETFGDKDLVRFIQQWGGLCLTGSTAEHALVFGFGKGKNGKSVWLNTLTGILNDYATTAAMDTFTASKSDRHPADLAMLRGARLVTASETEEGRSWAESRIKQLTGGDPISARFMQQDFFTFRPSFKLTIIGNHKSALRNVDEAARRRFNLVPFNRTPTNPDLLLEQKLKAEWPGILRWLIDGCLDWQANRLVRPESVVRATESYFEDQDLISQWLAEACDAEPGNRYKSAPVGVLFASWTEFASRVGETPGSIKAFSAWLEKQDFERGTEGHAKVRCFRGLMLRQRAADHEG